jgi:hypothetical protein
LGCADDTSVTLRVRFPDCSIDPDEVGTLLYLLEPADGTELVGLTAGSEQVDGVEVSGDDVDADGVLEWALRVRRAEHEIRDAFGVRVLARGSDAREIAVTLSAGDDENRQIGRMPGEPPTFRFREGQEQTLELPLVCMCLGMEGCGGTCQDGDDGCRPEGDHETYCHDGLHNDADDLRDCADPECYRRGPCAECDAELCDNDVDDDCDGYVDCGDDACVVRPACDPELLEDCENGGDDDRDTLRDCLDPDCEEHPACTGECEPVQEVCTNRRDDDCDHRVDCVDDECAQPAAETDCEDGFDDDCDNRVDCDDPDCYGVCGCDVEAEEERDLGADACHNGRDDDCDGTFDCEDEDCVGATPEDCDDTFDNDCDGLNNCADDDCPVDTADEDCDDLFDNDCDGEFDCEEASCRSGLPTERACGDFLDNDCDEKYDCDDPDCDDVPVCTGTSE